MLIRLLKDALIQNKKKQSTYEQSKDCTHMPDSYNFNNLSKHHCNQVDTTPR